MKRNNLVKILISALLVFSPLVGCNEPKETTWVCEECNHSGNTGKYCEECGAAKDKKSDDSTSTSSIDKDDESTSSENDSTSSKDDESTSTSSESTSTSSSSESTSDSSSIVDDEEYTILVQNNGNCEAYASASKAKAGETVTLTINFDAGYELDRITLNGNAMSGDTFIMPNTSARVYVYAKLSETSALFISGDINANLIEEEAGSGLYVARNVEISNQSYVCYNINGSELSCTEIDTNKSFADLEITTGHKAGFLIAGGATYDFYYDANNVGNNPCYVQRVKVNTLPTSDAELAALLTGKVKSTTTVNPSGVNKVTYSSSVLGSTYEWNLYENNVSFATATDNLTGELSGVVYKAYKGNNYKVVNTYIEETYSENDKRILLSDLNTKAFSANYDIVDTITKRYYQMSATEAINDVNYYSHNVEALDMEMYECYRGGYLNNIYNDVTVEGETTVTSQYVGSDGNFKVICNSWVRWKDSSYYDDASAYKTYNVEILFDERGAILSGSYNAYTYTDSYYDFTANKFLAGYESVKADKSISFTYSYGSPLKEECNFDYSPYFVSSIENVKVVGKAGVEGQIDSYEEITCSDAISAGEESSYTITFDYAPATALDGWQYGLVSSDDTSIVSSAFKGVGEGETKVTIGSKLENGGTASKKVDIKVQRNKIIRQFCIMTVRGYTPYYEDYDEAFVANAGEIYANKEYKVQITGTSSNGYLATNLGLTFDIDKPEYVDLSFDNDTGILTINTEKAGILEEGSYVTVTLTLSSDLQIDGWPKSTITLYIHAAKKTVASLEGTYNSTDSEATTYVTIDSSTSGTIYVGTDTYGFTYSYDKSSGKINDTKICSKNGKDNSGFWFTLKMYIDDEDGALCVCLIKDASWDDDGEDIVGYVSEDDDYPEYYYEAFIKA